MCIYVSMGMCECEYMCESMGVYVSMGVQMCVVWLSVRVDWKVCETTCTWECLCVCT